VRPYVGLNPALTFEKGDFSRTLSLALQPGKRRSCQGVRQKGLIRVNVAGYWDPEFREPLQVIPFIEDSQQAIQLYLKRMIIEEHFRDLKNLLQLNRLRNKSRKNMEKLVALVCIAYATRLIEAGGKMREIPLGEAEAAQVGSLAFLFFTEIIHGPRLAPPDITN